MSVTLTHPPAEETAPPPVAKIVPRVMTLHGDTRVDNYAWMRDRKDPDTIAYLEAENAYTKARMQHAAELEAKLYAEMLGRIQQTDLSVPVKRDEYFYYTRTEEGKQYSIFCRKHGSLDAAEEILLDGNAMAEGLKYFQIGVFAPSPNHKLLAYAVDLTGDEIYTIRLKDLATGEFLADEVSGASTSLEWAGDNATFFYNVLDEARRPFKIFRHVLGESKDAEIYHEPDQRFELEISKTSSRAYVLISSNSPLTTEIRCLRTDDARGEFRVVLPRVHETEYDLTHHSSINGGDSFFIRTNDAGRTFRVVQAPVADPSKAQWKEILPARPNVTVEGVFAFENHLVIEERELGLSRLRVQSFAG